MKLIKDVVITYNEVSSGNKVTEMRSFVKNLRDLEDSSIYFFEVGEDDEYVYFAAVGGHDWDPINEEDAKPNVVQVETAVYVKKTNEVVFFADNNGLSDPTWLDGYSYWTKAELSLVGALNFRDTYKYEMSNVSTWTNFV